MLEVPSVEGTSIGLARCGEMRVRVSRVVQVKWRENVRCVCRRDVYPCTYRFFGARRALVRACCL